jgi:hypothetical protein
VITYFLQWPVDLIPAEEGRFIVNFPDLPSGWSQRETRGEAPVQAGDLLARSVRARIGRAPPRQRALLQRRIEVERFVRAVAG